MQATIRHANDGLLATSSAFCVEHWDAHAGKRPTTLGQIGVHNAPPWHMVRK